MNDTYLMWLIWKVSDLEEQIADYTSKNAKEYTNNQVLIAMIERYEAYKECLEKYKEEKGE